MRRLQIKFPSQIRISGWDFGSSARAMNQAGGKDSLMTYESVPTQADLMKYMKSTTERKTMSTKTSIKRIALVAVAALGFGMVSAISANAANWTAWKTYQGDLDSINLKLATSSPTVDSAVYVNVGAVESSTGTDGGTEDGGTAGGAVTELRAYLDSYPVGYFASVSASTNVAGASAGTATVPTGATINASSNVLAIRDTDDAAGLAAYSVTSTSTTGIGSFYFTPTVAGTYVLKVFNDGPGATATTRGNNAADTNEAVQTISITVVAKAGFSTGYSTAYAVDGNGTSAATSTTDATPIAASKTAAAANAGAITVSMNNTSNVAMTSGNTLTASISGSGYLKWASGDDAPQANQCSATPTYSATLGRTISAQSADAVGTLYVCADGTAGTGTITLTATDAAGTSYALGTKTATFFGSVATLTATAVSKYIADSLNATDANTDNGGVVAAITATDSNGNNVELAAGDFTAVTAATLLAQSLDAVTFAAGDGDPYSASKIYVVINPTAGKTGARTLTLTHTSSEKTVDVAFTVSAVSAATVTATFDKTEYLPGEKATVTITSKDASGLFSPDATAATSLASNLSITTNKSVQGTLPTAPAFTNGVHTFSFYVPATTGTLEMNVKLAAGSAWATALDDTTIALTANVVSDSTTASDAVDAANEATDAANAATDAANAAAEAADAATAAAQDAQAAVAALATSVASLIAGIKAQITTLTNLVIKIQKKVKA